ncbi:MAG TPA: phosphoadenosine phosphosulfate reductase family protein [Flavobacteriales bacterium]|nr:phosphoadenosine phosphosulfate reductase family protein [Flavobacteriales bacterium]
MELVINFSGGKDSTAMLAWLCERYPDVPKHVVMADTGWEHEDAIEWSRGIVARFGLVLHVVRNPNKTLISMARKRGKFPGMSQRQCTSDLKRGPVHTWIRRRWPQRKSAPHPPVIVSCMGLRAEESSSRAGKPCLTKLNILCGRRREVWDWNPILGWTEVQVRAYLAERGLPLHPVYGHLRRFSCRVCIYMTDHDLRAVAQHDPAAIAIIATVEREIGFTMFQRGAIEELVVAPARKK